MTKKSKIHPLCCSLGAALCAALILGPVHSWGDSGTFSYTGPVVAIPDEGPPVFANLNVSGLSGQISKVVFRFDGAVTSMGGATTVGLDHTFTADLQITLISPDGTHALIINRVGNSGNNFAQTVLDDSASISIQSVTSGQAPYNGTWQPNEPLSTFNGLAPNGLWQLEVQDVDEEDSGNIRLWSLILTTGSTMYSILQNSSPVNVPTDANFIVLGTMTTGTPSESNTVSTLTFTPGSSLTIYNNLFVTNGPVTLVNHSSIKLSNGTLWTNALNINPGGTLSGNGGINGNLLNSGLVSPGNSPGRIHVSGDYTQSPLGTLKIEIAGRKPGQFDVLAVDGKANLGGTLELSPLNGFKLHRGDKFTFLTAGEGVNGVFSAVIDNFTNTILDPALVYRGHSVSLEVPTFGSFAGTYGLTQNETSVADGLDSINYDTRAAKLLNYLDNRNLSKLPGDFDKIAPDEITSIFTLGISLAQVQSDNIQRRDDDIRNGSSGFSASGLSVNGSGPGYSGNFGITTGVAGPRGDEGKEVKESKEPTPEEKRWGAFLSGSGEWVSVGNTDNARGYDLTSGGFTLGVDYKVCPNFAIGLAAGYTGTSIDLTDNGRVWVNGGKIGLYATTFAGGWYADAAAFGGYNSYDFRRSALEGEARGDTDGGELNVLVGTGYDFKAGGLTFGPTASFNYTYVGTSDFTEHGSLAPLNIHGGKGESLRTAFGFKASYDWKVGSVFVKPEVRAAWQHEYGDAVYDLTSSFANGAGDSFTVGSPETGRDSALLGAGFAVQFNDRCSTYVYYDGELGRKNYQSSAVTGGFRLAF